MTGSLWLMALSLFRGAFPFTHRTLWNNPETGRRWARCFPFHMSPSPLKIILTWEEEKAPGRLLPSQCGRGMWERGVVGRGWLSVHAKWNSTERLAQLGTGYHRAGSAQGSNHGKGWWLTLWLSQLPFHKGGSVRWEVGGHSTKN